MTNPKRAVIGTVIGVLIGFYFKTPFNDADWHGTVDGRLKFLPQAFKSMLEEQSEGLALAVYSDGEMLADLWGGYADKSSARLWDRDTLTNVFSTAKSIGALIIAILVTRGKLAYEDRVPKFWPEFAQNGKENITVQWIVEHKAGLVKFDGDFPIDHANDYRKVSKLIENSKPMWPAGTETGYHSITYGWILDQIVRRVDDKHRSLSQFYNEEIRILAKDDLYIGLPRSEHYRVARITHASRPNFIKSWVTSYFRIRHLLNSIKSGDLMRLMYASSDYPKWMTLITVRD
ncbi:hypothetical protein AB6A40_009141 [Gnathostoma spinigerum]|uniref:Beta-lactamase-related domain-containing protein n=1 Tax=Gnathostoma spinigerum TaxID=75299 RepID=A0ABD6F085_9BILA